MRPVCDCFMVRCPTRQLLSPLLFSICTNEMRLRDGAIVTTICFMVPHACAQSHMNKLAEAQGLINDKPKSWHYFWGTSIPTSYTFSHTAWISFHEGPMTKYLKICNYSMITIGLCNCQSCVSFMKPSNVFLQMS